MMDGKEGRGGKGSAVLDAIFIIEEVLVCIGGMAWYGVLLWDGGGRWVGRVPGSCSMLHVITLFS